MANTQDNATFEYRLAVRNILLVLFAVALFLMKREYSGPFEEMIHSYGGNVTVSFALYFVFLKLCMKSPQFGRLITAATVLACVETFEVFDGFGFMANTYDPFDLLANAVGVGIALGIELLLNKNNSHHSEIKPS